LARDHVVPEVDHRGRGDPAPEHEVQRHLPAPVRDRESVHLGLVEMGGTPPPLRDVSRLGDETEGDEPPDAAVAGGDGDLVPLGDLLGRQGFLMEGDEDPERVVIQERLPVLVVEEQLLGDQARMRRRTGTS